MGSWQNAPHRSDYFYNIFGRQIFQVVKAQVQVKSRVFGDNVRVFSEVIRVFE